MRRTFTCAVMAASFVLIFSSTTRAANYTVTDEQLDRLQRQVDQLSDSLGDLQRDFDSPRVIPDSRNRRQFVNDVRRINSGLKGKSGQHPWIERLKTGTPPPPPPVTPTLEPITLSQEFLQSTNYATYYEADFREASTVVANQCAAWSNGIRATSIGTVVTAECSGATQAKVPDGKIAAKVTGSVRLSFTKNAGLSAPIRVSGTFAANTGYATYYKEDYKQAVNNVTASCQNWSKEVLARSKGSFLYVQCASPKWTKGFDGGIWVEITGDLLVSHPVALEQPTTLNQQFVKTTGFATYYKTDVERAAAEAAAQCKTWASQTVSNSSATPIVVSCLGPEVLKNSNVEVRFQGTATFLAFGE